MLTVPYLVGKAGLEPAMSYEPDLQSGAVPITLYFPICAKKPEKMPVLAFALALSSGVWIIFVTSRKWYGERCRTRTGDQQLNRLLLYLLS